MTERFDENVGRLREDFRSDELIRDLLEEHYSADLPEYLRQRIDQELAEALRNKTQLRAISNGKALADGGTSTAHATDSAKSSPASSTSWRRPLARFLGAAAAVAACWLVFFSGIGGHNHTWAAIVEAMEHQTWWQLVSDEQDEAVGWLSIPSRVVAINDRRASSTVKSVWSGGVRSIYVAATRAIYQDPVELDRAMSRGDFAKAALLRLILGHVADEELDSWDVVDEGSMRVEGAIELRLKFFHSDSKQSVSVIFGVDEHTHLPKWMRVLKPDGTIERSVDFRQVTKGPSTIYELGVPQDTEVVGRLVSASTTSAKSMLEPRQSIRTTGDRNRKYQELGLSRPASKAGAATQTVMAQRVDELLNKRWRSLGLTPVEPATDSEFLRRIYLDLTGRIPTIAEIRRFENQTTGDRRSNLIEELLTSRDHAIHFGAVWRAMLLPSEADLANIGGASKLDAWLADQFRANVPYDAVVEQLLLAEGRVNETGPLLFYAAAKMNPEEIATQASRAFLGTRMECAQCHDHPFDHWTQEEFWGLAAYFARISRPQGKLEMVSPVLRVADNDWGDVKLPDSDRIVAPRFPFPLVDTENLESNGDFEGGSRRKQFVDWLVAPSNAQFSKATVNRVWAHLFGRGLVDPVDDMGTHNPPSCPEVLDELTAYFTQTDFDLRQLIATLVGTEAYQLSSRAADDNSKRRVHFAQMNIKSFSASQLYDSIVTATLRQEGNPGDVADANRTRFLEMFRVPPGSKTDYQAGIPQALMLINGDLMSESTIETGKLMRSLQAPFFTDEQRIENLFLATLSRTPTEREAGQVRAYLESSEDDLTTKQRLSDVLWTLLNSAEFTLNH